MATLAFPSLDDLGAALAATSHSINAIVDLIPSQYWFVEDHEQAMESRFHKHKKRPLEALAEKHGAPAAAAPPASKKAKLELKDANSVTARQQAMAAAAASTAKAGKGRDAEDDDVDSDSASDEDDDEFDAAGGADDDDDDNDVDMSGSDDSDSDEEEEQVEKKPLPTVSEWRAALEAARQTKNRRKLAKKAKVQMTQEDKRAQRKEGKTKQKKQRAIDQAKKESSDGQILAKDNEPTSNSSSTSTSTKSKSSKSADSVVEDIRFGNIDFGDDKKKKKGPANKDVKAQLLKAEQQKERLSELQATNPEKAKALKERAAWKKAMLQASGEKVKDDTALLKRAVKRKEKEKAKKKEEWAERKSTLGKEFKDKAKKRNENIQKKIDGIKAKNAKKRSAKKGR